MAEKYNYQLTKETFSYIQDLVYKEAGIQLSDKKQGLVISRLSKRIRALKLENFTQYCEYLEKNQDAERHRFVNEITTNLTFFFREVHHLEYLENCIIPDILSEKGEKKLRIWSAGCSTGQEPYSIAMILDHYRGKLMNWDAKILATDINDYVLGVGQAGIYNTEALKRVSPALQRKYFHQTDEDSFQVDDRLRKMISFKKHNMNAEKWPMNGPFDVIFCRNVMIYFPREVRQVLLERFCDTIGIGGYLIIGHSEFFRDPTKRMQSMGKTIFQRVK